jgi:UDP-glucose 4-epimerase
VALGEGVSRMAAWVRRVGSRKTKDFSEIEIPYGLPQGW